MKKKTFKSIALIMTIVLTGTAFTNCNGSGNSSDSDSSVATDGPLGEVPLLIAQYWGTEASAEGFQSLSDQTDAIKAAVEEVKDREITLEIAEGIPVKANSNLRISECKPPIEVTCYADAEKSNQLPGYAFIVYDTDGGVISAERGETVDNYYDDSSKTVKVTLRLQAFNAKNFAKIGKVVIVPKDGDEFKKASEAYQAMQQ